MTEFTLEDQKFGGAIGLLWVDLETTGAEENRDEIIEIGAILTDFNFERMDGRADRDFSIVIEPSEYALGRMMKNPVVRNMHIHNGLLNDCVSLPSRARAIEIAEQRLITYIQMAINAKKNRGDAGKFRFMLAGSGVGHFDNRFIRQHMPTLWKMLVFSPLDVGMVRRFLAISNVDLTPGADNTKSKDHRALGDILLHIEEAKAYRHELQTRLQSPF